MLFFVKYLLPVLPRLYISIAAYSTGYSPSFSPFDLFLISIFWISSTIPTDSASLVFWFVLLRRYGSFTKQECDFTCTRFSNLAMAACFKFTQSTTSAIMFPSSTHLLSMCIKYFWCFFVGDLMWTALETLWYFYLSWYLCCRILTMCINNVSPFITGRGSREISVCLRDVNATTTNVQWWNTWGNEQYVQLDLLPLEILRG